MPTTAVGVELCRVGVQRVWSSVEDVTLVFGGPRTGKTGWLAGRVLDAPGAAVVTSTRTDLLRAVRPAPGSGSGRCSCSTRSGSVACASTISFDPLTGCADPVTAMERATDMVSATSRATSGDAERWDAQARRVLAALLHAAALGGGSMRDVLGWVADNDRAAREVPALLRRSQVEAFEKAAEQFVTTNDRTRTSITNSIMPALGWLNHPHAAAAAAPGHGVRRRRAARLAGDGVPARRRGGRHRAAGVRADRAHRPRGPPARRAEALAAGSTRRCCWRWTRPR